MLKYTRLTLLLCIVLFSALSADTVLAQKQLWRWTNTDPGGGDYIIPGNWEIGSLPGTRDEDWACIDNGGIVNIVKGESVVGGRTYTGGEAPGTSGTLNVSASSLTSGVVIAGYYGTGWINITNKANLTTTHASEGIYVAMFDGSEGYVTISDSTAQTNMLVSGYWGKGAVDVLDNSVVTAKSTWVGVGNDGDGTLNVFNATLDAANVIQVGSGTTGVMNVG